jgi:trk system potassium uptake protein TrkH
MRFRAIADSLGIILMFFSATFAVPFIAIFIYWSGEHDPATQLSSCEEGVRTIISFLVPALICLLIGIALRLIGKGYSSDVRDREAFAIVSIGWVLIAFISCLPYIISGTIPNFFSAYFEAMSGFTTTGATVLEIPGNAPAGADYLDVYPHSIMLWRSLTQFMGGMGIIVLSVVILSRFIGGGASLIEAETPGPASTRIKHTVTQTARALWVIYITFAVLQITSLRLAGMNGFDALNHTFTTLATGGFSTHVDSIAHYNNPWIEGIIIFFMVIAGISFVLHYNLIAGRGNKLRLLKDPEMRFYLLLLTLGTVLIMSVLVGVKNFSTIHSFRVSSFQAVSIMTTCGYTTTDFSTWPQAAQFMLLLLMLIGGCSGSTSGAIKVVRILVVLKLVRREVKRMVRSRAIMSINLGSASLPEKTVAAVAMYFIIYISIFFACSLLMTVMGYDIVSSMGAVATTMGGVGPGLGSFGPANSYEPLPFYGKLLLSVCMWLGRLEIFAGLFLLFPSTYRH